MEPLIGRTVSQIKNRYYQNLKGKDLDKIKYILDEEENSKALSLTNSILEVDDVKLNDKEVLFTEDFNKRELK